MSEVVITGWGACGSSGASAAALWASVAALKESASPLGASPASGYARALQLARDSITEALTHAGLWDGGRLQGCDPERVGSTFSVSKPLWDGEAVVAGDALQSPLAKRFGWAGETRNVVAACATGPYAVALGAGWIEAGLCDIVIAGSVEPRPHDLYRAGFAQMGVLTADAVMRPFDRHRSGFVFGEGSAALVLESALSARARHAPVRARLSGWACGADNHSPFAFNSGGEKIANVIHRAIARARLSARDIGYVNAHGTATRLNDALETQALKRVFGRQASQVAISATKSTTGHLLGAAGSLEAAITLESLTHQTIPPTSHWTTADPECDLDYTPNQARASRFDHALTVSFGFGGPIGALVISR